MKQQFINRLSSWQARCQRLFFVLTACLLASQLIITPAGATGIYEIPAPTSGTWVIDQAEVLSRATESQLNGTLDQLAQKTGYGLYLVSFRRLDYDETAQSFADKLFERWFSAPETAARQVLLVIDSQTNKTGIHVGDQTKALLTDEIAHSVAQETVLFALKQGDKYNQALTDASDRLVAVLSGAPDPGAPTLEENIAVEGTFASKEETQSSNAMIWVFGFLVVATIVPMATYYFYQYTQSR